jgi:chromosome segregation ATPase
VYQDSTSKYLLNQQIISPKELVTFLKPFGVDLNHSRFLILQGEVEQIATLKPKSQVFIHSLLAKITTLMFLKNNKEEICRVCFLLYL